MNNRIALYDMDGTLADYNSSMKDKLTTMLSPADFHTYGSAAVVLGDAEPTWMKARRNAISRDPEFWRNLPRCKLGFDLWNVTKDIGFTHMIATKGPRSASAAWIGKVEWVNRELGENVPITVTTDKSLLYGRVLVDDWPEYMLAWIRNRPRGLGVMPAQEWNKDFRHPQVIRYDGTNLVEVRNELQAAYDRNIGDDNAV